MKAAEWNIPEECQADMLDKPFVYLEGSGSLGTYGVGSCWVAMLYARSDKKRGILTHCPAERGYHHSAGIGRLLKDHPQMKASPVRRAVMLVDDSYRFHDPIFPGYRTLYAVNMRDIAKEVENGFGIGLEIVKYPYTDTKNELNEVILSLDDAAWSAWFGKGRFEPALFKKRLSV